MSCSPFDLKDYLFQELPANQRREVEKHVAACEPCREELAGLRLTQTALLALQDEEIPQRIGFVSDPIFEPSPWRRAWAAFWGSGPRLGFAAAAMLSAALVFATVNRPAPAPAPHSQTATLTAAEIDARIDARVRQAALEIEASQTKKAEQLVASVKQRDAAKLNELVRMASAQTEYFLQQNAELRSQVHSSNVLGEATR
ncbi:MAG TPA: zf-HC2 domain-containing protein [Candidatus Limnocylindrales bacterium]|nr:zf-HC2 domain-containing protein [Candidatus Limnocylindrales bacterium]